MFVLVVERVKEQLKLSLEHKSGLVQTGELIIVLDGLVLEPEARTNPTSLVTSKLNCVYACVEYFIILFIPKSNFISYCLVEVQQNGDALHENRETSARTTSRSDFIYTKT